MRIALLLLAAWALSACGDDPLSASNTLEFSQDATTQFNAQQGPPISPPGIGGQPAQGTGTPGQLAVWLTQSSIGNAPIRVDENGNLLVRPGVAIILQNEDGTKCWRLSGDGFQKLTPNCPTY